MVRERHKTDTSFRLHRRYSVTGAGKGARLFPQTLSWQRQCTRGIPSPLRKYRLIKRSYNSVLVIMRNPIIALRFLNFFSLTIFTDFKVSDPYYTLILLRRLVDRLAKFKLYLKDIHNKTWFNVGFLKKLFQIFKILYIKVCIETYERNVFLAYKTRGENYFSQILW